MRFDPDSEVYELFASEECDDYLGCADSPEEAKRGARAWFDSWMNE